MCLVSQRRYCRCLAFRSGVDVSTDVVDIALRGTLWEELNLMPECLVPFRMELWGGELWGVKDLEEGNEYLKTHLLDSAQHCSCRLDDQDRQNTLKSFDFSSSSLDRYKPYNWSDDPRCSNDERYTHPEDLQSKEDSEVVHTATLLRRVRSAKVLDYLKTLKDSRLFLTFSRIVDVSRCANKKFKGATLNVRSWQRQVPWTHSMSPVVPSHQSLWRSPQLKLHGFLAPWFLEVGEGCGRLRGKV